MAVDERPWPAPSCSSCLIRHSSIPAVAPGILTRFGEAAPKLVAVRKRQATAGAFVNARSVKSMVDSQKWDADNYARTASFVPRLGLHLIERLAPQAGELILDVGCGDGTLTAEIAASGARVIGIDSSADMLAAARRRGLDARLMRAEQLDLQERFDAAFSNAALHWVRDLDAAVAGIARHLAPGGRFVGEFGGHGNVAAILTAILATLAKRGIDGRALTPWHYPTAEAFAGMLSRHGFDVEEAVLVPRPTPLDAGMTAWIGTFCGAFLDALSPDDRVPFAEEVAELLAPSLRDPDGRWTADYVRLRFRARLMA
jgi:trans-aconitate methyltransferase